jgi:CPA2 family monovalent cation:H+ antiporter-2
MLATPLWIATAPRVGLFAQALFGRRAVGDEADEAADRPSDHVIVVGFGVNGRQLARVLGEARIPFRVVELNADTVRQSRRQGTPILFGDATRPEILAEAGVARAQVIVFAISDWAAVRRSVRLARGMSPRLHIIVRTRMVSEIEDLQRAGADEVIAEEFETSIEIFTRVLARYHVPRNVVRAQTRVLRGEGYKMLRAPALATGLPEEILDILAAGTTDLFRLEKGSPADGKTLRELDFRRQTGASVIAVVRGETPHPNPAADFRLAAGDVLVVVGSHAEIDQAFRLLDGG